MHFLPAAQFHAMFSELRRMFGPSKVRSFTSIIIIKATAMGKHSVWILSCVNTPRFRTVLNQTGNVWAKTSTAVFRWKPKPNVELSGSKGTGQRPVSGGQLSRSDLVRAVRCLQGRDLSCYCRRTRNETMVFQCFHETKTLAFPFFL